MSDSALPPIPDLVTLRCAAFVHELVIVSRSLSVDRLVALDIVCNVNDLSINYLLTTVRRSSARSGSRSRRAAVLVPCAVGVVRCAGAAPPPTATTGASLVTTY